MKKTQICLYRYILYILVILNLDNDLYINIKSDG